MEGSCPNEEFHLGQENDTRYSKDAFLKTSMPIWIRDDTVPFIEVSEFLIVHFYIGFLWIQDLFSLNQICRNAFLFIYLFF